MTTGENEAGYRRSREFFSSASAAGYPVIYKAYPGLAHQGSEKADRLGLAVFDMAIALCQEEYARTLRQRGEAVTIVKDIELLPSSVEQVKLCGAERRAVFAPTDYPRLREVVYLSPRFELPSEVVDGERYLVGEFSPRLPRKRLPNCEVVDGAEYYLGLR